MLRRAAYAVTLPGGQLLLEIYILRQAHVWTVVNIGLQLGSLQPPAPATQLAMEPQGGEFVQNHWITFMSSSTHRIFTLIHGTGLMADSFSSLVSISFGFSMETYFRTGAHFGRFAISFGVPTTVLWGRRKSLPAVW